jgi:hypothetical protein
MFDGTVNFLVGKVRANASICSPAGGKTGVKKPSGMALKLLDIVEKNGPKILA